jgi:hypothetical protein
MALVFAGLGAVRARVASPMVKPTSAATANTSRLVGPFSFNENIFYSQTNSFEVYNGTHSNGKAPWPAPSVRPTPPFFAIS